MNGEIAQLVALVAHGNSFFAERGRPPELFPGHATFRFVHDVSFADVVDTTAPWFVDLESVSDDLYSAVVDAIAAAAGVRVD